MYPNSIFSRAVHPNLQVNANRKRKMDSFLYRFKPECSAQPLSRHGTMVFKLSWIPFPYLLDITCINRGSLPTRKGSRSPESREPYCNHH